MNQKSTSNNIENDEYQFGKQESEYENLISRLGEISTIIAILEKKVFK